VNYSSFAGRRNPAAGRGRSLVEGMRGGPVRPFPLMSVTPIAGNG